MPEVNNANQNDNVSAFDSILNKYSALLIKVDKLKDENANIKAESSQKINVDLTKVTAEQFFSKIDSALNEIKKEISQINIVLSEVNKKEKDLSEKPRRRKKKSTSTSFFKKFKSSIGFKKNN